MESLNSITSLEIPTNKIFYDKKSNVFSAEILGFMFVGTYKKSTRISKILDDIFTSLKEIHINRNDLHFIDFVTNTEIPETTKLKHLKLLKKKKPEKKKEKPEEKREFKDLDKAEVFEIEEEELFDEDIGELLSVADDVKYKEEVFEEEKLLKRDDREREESRRMRETPKAKKKSRALLSQPPPGAGAPPSKTPAPSVPPPRPLQMH